MTDSPTRTHSRPWTDESPCRPTPTPAMQPGCRAPPPTTSSVPHERDVGPIRRGTRPAPGRVRAPDPPRRRPCPPASQAPTATPARLSSSSSGLSNFDWRVNMLELYTGIGDGEAPVDRGLGVVAPTFPGPDLDPQHLGFAAATTQALPLQDRKLRLRPVQPTAVLGRVVNPQPPRQ